MSNETVTIDVRDDIRNGREPFSRIMKAIRDLEPRQKLLLIAPFRPTPLFAVLKKLGFVHNACQVATGDWEVLLMRAKGISEEKGSSLPDQAASQLNNPCDQPFDSKETRFVDLDARGLEPPQPMVSILEALAGLPENAGLRACTDRRPMHLYAQLEARGFIGKSEEQNDGSFITHIWAR